MPWNRGWVFASAFGTFPRVLLGLPAALVHTDEARAALLAQEQRAPMVQAAALLRFLRALTADQLPGLQVLGLHFHFPLLEWQVLLHHPTLPPGRPGLFPPVALLHGPDAAGHYIIGPTDPLEAWPER